MYRTGISHMKLTPLKTLLFSITASLSFTACSISPTQTTTSSQALEQVKNIEATPSTENNVAKLILQPQNCLIEFKGYFDGGEAVEHWTFNQQGLISANSTTIQYAEQAQPAAQTATAFDTQDPATQANFKKLQSNFSADNLAKCH